MKPSWLAASSLDPPWPSFFWGMPRVPAEDVLGVTAARRGEMERDRPRQEGRNEVKRVSRVVKAPPVICSKTKPSHSPSSPPFVFLRPSEDIAAIFFQR